MGILTAAHDVAGTVNVFGGPCQSHLITESNLPIVSLLRPSLSLLLPLPASASPCILSLALMSHILSDGICLRVCGCIGCNADTRPVGPRVEDIFYDNIGQEFIYDGQEWLPTGKTNWRFVAEVPVRMTTFHVREATTVVLGVETTGPLKRDQRHDFSIEARNLNEIGYGTRALIRGATPVFLPPTPILVFAMKPQARSCLLLWDKGANGPQYGPTDFFRAQIHDVKRNVKYFDERFFSARASPSAILYALWPATEYDIKVFAGNDAGLDPIGGPTNRSNTVTTLPYPSGIGISSIDTGNSCGIQCNGCPYRPGCSITLYWDPVPNQDELEYKVAVRLFSQSDDNPNPWLVKASEVRGNMVKITDLGPPDTLYDVCIYGRVIDQTYDSSCTLHRGIKISSAPSHAVADFRVDNMTATSLRLSWRALEDYDAVTLRETEYVLEQSTDGFAPDHRGLENTIQVRALHHPSPDIPWMVLPEDAQAMTNYRLIDAYPFETQLYSGIRYHGIPHATTPCHYDDRYLCIYTEITGLTPGQPVHYRVRSRNANTAGLSSQASYLSTAPFPRCPSARNLRVVNVTDTSVLLMWERPLGTVGTSVVWNEITWEPNGRLQVDGTPIKIGYNESLKTEDGACDQGMCWYNATQLIKNRIYTFHIRLDNNHESGYEPGVRVKGAPVGVPDAPSNAFVSSVTSESIRVRWQPPHGVAYTGLPGVREPIKYRLRCRLMPGYTPQVRSNASACNNLTHFSDSGVEVKAADKLPEGVPQVEHPYSGFIPGLDPGVGYRVQVCSGGLNEGYGSAYFDEGCGPFVEAVTSAPPDPIALSSPGVGTTSVSLSWTPAPVGQPGKDIGWNFLEGMDVAGYTISCPGGDTISQLKTRCEALQNCVGFNTFGCLKSYIPPFWLSMDEGQERNEWLLISQHKDRLSAKAATATAAASAGSATIIADALPASEARVAELARQQAATSAAAAAVASREAQYLTSDPLQTHANGTCCVGDPIYNQIGVMTYAGWTATPGQQQSIVQCKISIGA